MIGTRPEKMRQHYAATTANRSPTIAERVVAVLAFLNGASVFHTLFEFLGIDSAVVTALWLAIYLCIVVMLFWNHDIQWVSWLCRRHILLTIVLLAAFASTLWSINSSITLQRATHLIGSSLVGIWFGYTFGARYFFATLTWILSILIVGSIATSLLLPDFGLQLYEGKYVWKGLHSNKNALGLTAAISIAYFALGFLTGRLSRIACIGMVILSLIVLAKANSATSILSLGVAMLIGITFYYSAKLRLRPVMAIALLIVIGSVAGLASLYIPAEELTGTFGRSSSLTGRTELWAATWEITKERPWFGFGYGSIWFPREGTEFVQENLLRITWFAHHAHNGFLQISSELGIPIAVIAVLLLPLSMAQAIYLYARHASLFGLFGLVLEALFVVSNFSEVRIFVDRNFHWMLFIAVMVALLRAAERRRLEGVAQQN